MKIHPDDFRVRPASKVDLRKWPTEVKRAYESKQEYRQLLDQQIGRLSVQQGLLYAQDRYALLVIFQAMDAAGKDSAIRHVMSGINPQGCQVFSFKQPSAEDLDHDFLWNAVRRLPERGRIGIFNRSYYEEVLIVRVHPEILRAQRLPLELMDEPAIWRERCRSIANLEAHLHRNGTRIVKFYLHLSKEEQRKRLLKRIDQPEKNWKVNQADVEERRFWADYMKAYSACLQATSTRTAPWYVVPADDKENAQLIISRVLVDTLAKLKMKYPAADPARRKELQVIRKLLAK
jgi:PPK2 family polyphosphate:nucleotide phosphotransferase